MSEESSIRPRDPELAATTDVCVKCGLCLPHCPTYLKTSDENESPRGRLSLIQGWAQGALELSSKLTDHVDQCLLDFAESNGIVLIPFAAAILRGN